MARYMDGFVLPLQKSKVPQYKRIARLAARVWKDCGALDYVECVGDDLDVAFGARFPKVLRCRKGETVVFATITYRSRAHRDRVNAKVMKDPRLASMCGADMPFDMKRMVWGGFKSLVEG